jgi:2-iminobutanoate/2-iminopropanoate deaminase
MPKQVPDVPSGVTPLGPYSTVTEAAGLVFVSGQVAIDPATDAPIDGDVRAQAVRVMENLGAILGDLGLGYEDVVKTTIFLDDMADFPAVNDVYGGYFTGAPPARSTVEAGALPGGFLVEIEAIAAR